MGVGVEAPGRDHHSMTSPTEQSHNMTNGFNSDNHGRNSGVDDQHNGEKTSHTKNSDSAAAASTHSPAEPEEKSLESKTVELNTKPILENGLENPEVSNGILEDRISAEDTKMLGDTISKLEDCNSSKDSIDVESTQPEDIKPVKNETNSTASMDTKVKGSVETTQASSSLVQPANLKEETVQPEIDWSLYHLGDMTLDVWLQIFRKHVVMALLRHPKSEVFRQPVDPVALGIFPFYNQVITQPMDLGTVRNKIEKGLYEDKSSCLKDVNQVWLNAKKFNPVTHVVHQSADSLQQQMFNMLQNLVKSGGATSRKSLPPVTPVPPPMRHVGIREAKKRPLGLPGEYDDIKPQHLEQKYASRLSEPLKQCDTIIRNLMLQSQHWDYVEPFMKPVNNSKGKPLKMSLALIYDRLRGYHYSNALEFATDIRRIVTETYRSATEPIEEDFKSQKARLLQREFEFQFAKVKDDEDDDTNGMNKASILKDPYIVKLMKAEEALTSISNKVSALTSEVVSFMDLKRDRRNQRLLQYQNSSAMRNSSAINKQITQPPSKKRQRTTPNKKADKNKVRRIERSPSPTASPEQIGDWIQNLDADGQEHLLEILKKNNEEIEVDEDGEVELSLENWSKRTLVDVEIYLRLKLSGPIRPTNGTSIPIVQNHTQNNPANENYMTAIPEYHLPSHVPGINNSTPVGIPYQRGGKKLSQLDNRKKKSGRKKDGQASSSDSSDSSEDSSSSDGHSSDEN